jgi:cell division septation protein DedD
MNRSLFSRLFGPVLAALAIYAGVLLLAAPDTSAWKCANHLSLIAVAASVFLLFLWRECRPVDLPRLRVGWHYVCLSSAAIWRAFSFLVIPAVFSLLLLNSLAQTPKPQISILHIVLAALALSPWIVRLLATHFSEFEFGLQGAKGKFATRPATELPVAAPREPARPTPAAQTAAAPAPAQAPRTATATETPAQPAAPPAAQPRPERPFQSLTLQAKAILKTLWHFQRQHFGADRSQRWGFTQRDRTPQYINFSIGLLDLIQMGLVVIDGNGFVFLSDLGFQYCEQQHPEIEAYPYHYSNFSAA